MEQAPPLATETIPATLRLAAERHGERPALVQDDTTLSFRGLLDQVRVTARGYAALGLSAGDRVCVWAPNSVEWVVAALATSYAGAALVPANSRYTAHEVLDLAQRTDARLLVIADGFLDRTQVADLVGIAPETATESAAGSTTGSTTGSGSAPGPVPAAPGVVAVIRLPGSTGPATGPAIGPGLVDWADLPGHAAAVSAAEIEARADAVTGDDVADIMFTSGTTGRPKGAVSAHRQTLGVAAAWAGIGGVGAEDRYLVVNPFFHTFGYKVGIVVGLLTGATLYPMAVFDLAATMDLIERERITLLPGAPTIFQTLLGDPDRAGRDLSSLRLAITGAAVVPVVLIERMRADSPEGLGIDEVLTAFGQTEAVVATMCRPGDPPALVANTCGRAIPGMEARIADGPEPGEGELMLRGDYVMLGYLDDPVATAEAIEPDGWLHTGDVGRIDADGNLTITDRLKDMYISGGFNVYPAEVEQALARLDGVADCAVVGIPDERLGEVGKAYVVRAADASLSAEDVVSFARERLANFKVPRQVAFLDVLPRNLSGKVLKTELRNV